MSESTKEQRDRLWELACDSNIYPEMMKIIDGVISDADALEQAEAERDALKADIKVLGDALKSKALDRAKAEAKLAAYEAFAEAVEREPCDCEDDGAGRNTICLRCSLLAELEKLNKQARGGE